jgi:CrcB protein
MIVWLGFAGAAAVGAMARFVIDREIQVRTRSAFPFGILTVNIAGCFALGVLTGLARGGAVDEATMRVLGTGGLGAFTTFSTFSVGVVGLVAEGNSEQGVRYLVATLVSGAVAAALGLALGASVS